MIWTHTQPHPHISPAHLCSTPQSPQASEKQAAAVRAAAQARATRSKDSMNCSSSTCCPGIKGGYCDSCGSEQAQFGGGSKWSYKFDPDLSGVQPTIHYHLNFPNSPVEGPSLDAWKNMNTSKQEYHHSEMLQGLKGIKPYTPNTRKRGLSQPKECPAKEGPKRGPKFGCTPSAEEGLTNKRGPKPASTPSQPKLEPKYRQRCWSRPGEHYRTPLHCTATHRTQPHYSALHASAPHATAPHRTPHHRTPPHATVSTTYLLTTDY